MRMTRVQRGGFRLKNVAIKLLLVNVAVSILKMVLGQKFMFDNFALVGQDVLTRPWILFTSMFLHAGFTHLLFNMYALFLFGTLIERRIGSKRFLWAYLVSGVVASVIFTLANPSGLAVGASGAIMAVLGLVIMLMPDLRVLFFFVIPMSMRTAGIIFALIDLVGFVYGGTGIAHAAHLGGLACGLAYGYYLKRKGKSFKKGFQNQGRRFREPKRRSPYYDAEQTIELSQDDIDQYYKYGRL